ncbi:MAG TPA: lysophospholipid acyltransferase family protein [Longimicrobiales bacterium]|nr:lysophospholipid acyltransferase family protein [Longimicrobiales bacterium]
MSQWKYRLGGLVGRGLLNGLLGTVRFQVEGKERLDAFLDRGEPVIFCLWHGRLLPLTYYHRGGRIATLISQSGDGEYIARVVAGWGYLPVRGSTSRGGGAALKELVRRARQGWSLAMTPDGPRGPRQELQPGVITAAQLTGLPIIPLAAGTSRAWWPGSWDRFCVPKPFARVRVLYGTPRKVARDADDSARRHHMRELEAEMNAMIQEVDRDGGPNR